MQHKILIEGSRYPQLEDQFSLPYFQHIIQTIKNEKNSWIKIYPKWSDIFRAFELTHWEDVKVIILGQDPYHNIGQAHGLCFSVPSWVTPPPSLINIFKEIEQEYPMISSSSMKERGVGSWGYSKKSGDLSDRAAQWVLMLNAFLTVQASTPLSHSKIGWEVFTDHIISLLSKEKDGLVFMLWGWFAKSKAKLIDNQKHLILTANHPSPLSANKWWWFGNDHFRLCNDYLEKQGKKAIQW